MHLYLNIFGFTIPVYGLMIVVGVLLSNIIAYFLVHKYMLNYNDFIILEAYAVLGGFIGSKMLYLIIFFKNIEWNRLFEAEYFNILMQGGFVFYGGLIVGSLFLYFAGSLHKINVVEYLKKVIPIVPLAHCFGRIGCFCAGCCYGIPYSGIGSVIFPHNSFAIPDIQLFPVQLVEAGFLFFIFILILYFEIKYCFDYTIEVYLIAYSILRFCMEFLRYDNARGFFLFFSTSQWISIFMFLFSFIIIFLRKTKSRKIKL